LTGYDGNFSSVSFSHAYGSKPFKRAVPSTEYMVAVARAPRGEPANVQLALLEKHFGKRAYRQVAVIEASALDSVYST
jgi:hypothetical protein